MRTTGEKDTYEWWYFDTHLDDGSSLVVVFYTKPFIGGVGKGLAPYVSVELDRPDGSHHQWEAKADAAGFHAASDRCDVTIGPNTFRNVEWGEPLKYRIHVEEGPLLLDIDLIGQVPPWRPGTGYMYFGEQDEHFFAWLPSVPQGSVVVDLVLDGVQETLTGVGYRDHNWGDVAMTKLINHWYWGRAQAGAYSIVSSYITAEANYGSTEIPIFMLAKDGAVVADDPGKVRFSLEGEQVDEHSGKPFAQVVTYKYKDGTDRYVIRYQRKSTIVDDRMIDQMTGPGTCWPGRPGSTARTCGSRARWSSGFKSGIWCLGLPLSMRATEEPPAQPLIGHIGAHAVVRRRRDHQVEPLPQRGDAGCRIADQPTQGRSAPTGPARVLPPHRQ